MTEAAPAFHTEPTGAPNRLDDVSTIADAVGFPLLPWARRAIEVATEYEPETLVPIHRRSLFTIPRQSGKSIVVAVLALELLLRHAGAYAVYLAQSRAAATSRLRTLGQMLYESGLDTSAKVTLGTGNERLRLSNGSVLEVQSPSATSTHGESIDAAFLDEAFAIDPHVMAAVSPAMAARPRAQLFVVSTQGTLADSILLNELTAIGRADPAGGMCYVEYSKPDDIALMDHDRFAEFHPGIGHTTSVAVLNDEARYLPAGEFARAYGNIATAVDTPWLPEGLWEAAGTRAGELPDEITIGIDATEYGAAIAAAYPTDDGFHVDLVEYRDGKSHEWLVERLVQLSRHEVGAIAWDRLGPVSTLTAPLEDLCDTKTIVNMRRTGNERARGDLLMFDLLHSSTVTHNVLEPLEAAVKSAVTVPAGDGMWRISRSKAVVDPAPLIAATLALGAAHELAALKPAPLLSFG